MRQQHDDREHCYPTPPLPPAEVQHGNDRTLPPLYVVTCISNPERSNVRYQLWHEFAHRVEAQGGLLYTVELQLGDRPFALTDEHHHRHVQFRSQHELWHKENLLNLGIQRLPDDWQYVAWIDSDVSFTNPHWVNETLQQLQHFGVVQMFTHAIDQGPNYEPLQSHRGFVYGWRQEPGVDPDPGTAYGNPSSGVASPGSRFHPGFAWAARRDVLDQLGGLYEMAVMGSADTYMARGMAGYIEGALGEAAQGLTDAYNYSIMAWQERAHRVLQGNVGYVDSLLLHYWHGKKKDRRYFDRNKVMIAARFDPHVDLIHDTRGVLALAGNKPALRDGLRSYFRLRNEDSIDL